MKDPEKIREETSGHINLMNNVISEKEKNLPQNREITQSVDLGNGCRVTRRRFKGQMIEIVTRRFHKLNFGYDSAVVTLSSVFYLKNNHLIMLKLENDLEFLAFDQKDTTFSLIARSIALKSNLYGAQVQAFITDALLNKEEEFFLELI